MIEQRLRAVDRLAELATPEAIEALLEAMETGSPLSREKKSSTMPNGVSLKLNVIRGSAGVAGAGGWTAAGAGAGIEPLGVARLAHRQGGGDMDLDEGEGRDDGGSGGAVAAAAFDANATSSQTISDGTSEVSTSGLPQPALSERRPMRPKPLIPMRTGM